MICSRPASAFTIRAGTSIRNYEGKVLEVQTVFQHPNYDDDVLNYDISVLELAEAFEFNNKIRPIELASDNDELVPGTVAVVSGWGLLNEDGELSSQLQAVDVPIINLRTCKRYYEDFTDSMFCAGYKEGGRDSCQVNFLLFSILKN